MLTPALSILQPQASDWQCPLSCRPLSFSWKSILKDALSISSDSVGHTCPIVNATVQASSIEEEQRAPRAEASFPNLFLVCVTHQTCIEAPDSPAGDLPAMAHRTSNGKLASSHHLLLSPFLRTEIKCPTFTAMMHPCPGLCTLV